MIDLRVLNPLPSGGNCRVSSEDRQTAGRGRRLADLRHYGGSDNLRSGAGSGPDVAEATGAHHPARGACPNIQGLGAGVLPVGGGTSLPQRINSWNNQHPVKRVFDIIAAALGLLAASPVLVGAMFVVWLQDKHSPFYLATRVGKNGRPFRIVKLRSMVVDAEKSGVDSTSVSDPRITPVGRFHPTIQA